MVDGFAIGQSAVEDSWQHFLGEFLHSHTGEQQLFHQFDIAFIVKRAKHQHAFEYFTTTKYSTLKFYRTLQPAFRYADYLSTIRCVTLSNRRLVSRFRTGCHGLQIDTDRSQWVEGVHMFLQIGVAWFAICLDVGRTSSTFFRLSSIQSY